MIPLTTNRTNDHHLNGLDLDMEIGADSHDLSLYHLPLPFLQHNPAVSTEEYRTLNDQQRGRLARRETKYFTSATAQTLIDGATSLLDSAEWSERA